MNMPTTLGVPEISVTVDDGAIRVEQVVPADPQPTAKPKRILLSQANVTDLEVQAVSRAVKSGWVTPLGPEVDGFESEICSFVEVANAVALSSGTAALHLGLLGLGVRPGDDVIVPTLTFGATAFSVTYTGARPLLLDVEEQSWGLDPDLLAEVLEQRARSGRQVAAIIPVDLFGIPADYDRILAVAGEHDVPVLIDAAEALGARHQDRAAGTMGHAGVYSFNGNKIMTTSGGGMLVSDDRDLVEKARFWSTQSREPFPWYWHEEIGYNYRMSNILAALGRAQLQRLPKMVARRQAIRRAYTELLGDLEGVRVTQDPSWATGNSWLSTVRFDRAIRPAAANRVRVSLEAQDIETRPIWKPMHHQPVFAAAESFNTGIADRLFEEGLCLPSGVGLTDSDIERVAGAIRGVLAQG
ncbi:MAG: aminotransferase class I/II-fold pyridoxal phosphate-dependent enzyme [Candidatus Nanopelagicales bacterium]